MNDRPRWPRCRCGLLAALGLSVLASCSQPPSPVPGPRTGDRIPLVVTVFELQPRALGQTIDAFGSLVAARKLSLGVETAGTVERVLFSEGQHIAAGQPLVLLDDRKQKLRLQRARADVASATALLNQAESTFGRYRDLRARGVVAEENYRQTESAYQTAQAALEQATAARDLARQELLDLTLSSPVAGVVEAEFVEAGQRVGPGERLALIATSDSLQVHTYVSEREVNRLRLGDGASVRLPAAPGRRYRGWVESVARAADRSTGNFLIKLRLDDPGDSLREGMSARITLQAATGEPRLAVPAGALVDHERRRVVFVAREGRAVAVSAEWGLSAGAWVPVHSGLAAGDRVIMEPIALLTDGRRVAVGSEAGVEQFAQVPARPGGPAWP